MVQAKLDQLSLLFEKRYGRRPLSHMSDSWDFSSNLLNGLVANGYLVDCSFAPGVSQAGIPHDNPLSAPYFPALQNPSQRGFAPVLEVPIATCSPFDELLANGDVLPNRIGATLSPIFGYAFGQSKVVDVLRSAPRITQSHLSSPWPRGLPESSFRFKASIWASQLQILLRVKMI